MYEESVKSNHSGRVQSSHGNNKYMKKLEKQFNPLNLLSSKAYKSFVAQSSDLKPGPNANTVSSTLKIDYYDKLKERNDDVKSMRSVAMTERKSIKNYNKSLDKKINDTYKDLERQKSIYSRKGVCFENLYNVYQFDQMRSHNKFYTPRKSFDVPGFHKNSNSTLTLKFNTPSKLADINYYMDYMSDYDPAEYYNNQEEENAELQDQNDNDQEQIDTNEVDQENDGTIDTNQNNQIENVDTLPGLPTCAGYPISLYGKGIKEERPKTSFERSKSLESMVKKQNYEAKECKQQYDRQNVDVLRNVSALQSTWSGLNIRKINI
eukprot:Mrub_05398.p1 GENE.Mrub_05398~~Mrub_05398.p1  ORF type:complete len:365 (+),score=74.11 Mrub_05398:134-1096(+)